MENPLVNVNSYFANLLFYKSFNPRVANFNNAWIRAWKSIQTGELFGKSMATAHPRGLFHTAIMKNQTVRETIATSTQSGSNLIITFSNPTYDKFRVHHKVTDSSENEAIVVASAPGTITIAPLNNPTTLTAGTHFAENSTIWDRGKLAGLYNSTGTTSIYYENDVQEDYTELTRNSQGISAMEKTHKYAAYVNGETVIYGYKKAEMDAVNDFIFNCVYKYFFSKGGTNIQTLEGFTNKTYGVRNRLIDAGNYLATSSEPTRQQFEQALMSAADAVPSYQQNMMILPGREFARLMSEWYPAQMAYAGGQRDGNTVSVSLDLREIHVAGISAKVAMDFNILNDTERLPYWHKWDCYILNRSLMEVDGLTRSPIQLIHFSQNPSAEYKALYRCVPGMVGVAENDDTGLGQIAGWQNAGSAVHGSTIEMLDLSGVSVIPTGHFLIEYQH